MRDLPWRGEARGDIANHVVSDQAGAYPLRRATILGKDVCHARRIGRDFVASSTRIHGSVAKNHDGLHAIAKAKPDHLREETTCWKRLLTRVLQAGKDDKADRSALRSEDGECRVRPSEKIAISALPALSLASPSRRNFAASASDGGTDARRHIAMVQR